MTEFYDIFPYIQFITSLVSASVAIGLVYFTKTFVGRSWLMAAAILMFVSWPGAHVISLIARYSDSQSEVYSWFRLLTITNVFMIACVEMFMFSIWRHSRMRLENNNLLFSFSGRIPRSAFWIVSSIMAPIGTATGYQLFITHDTGLIRVAVLTVYVLWLITSIWISLAIYAKRWHDCGKSGWMSLVLFIPLVGPFWLLGYCGFVKGQSDTNQYGANPLDLE